MTTFVSTWNIPANTTLVLPINANTLINCVVNWGDTTTTPYTNYTVTNLNRPSRLYQNGGTINIEITGTLPGWSFQNGLIDAGVATSASLLVSITSFGGVRLSTQGYGFLNCINLEYIPQPPVITRYDFMFKGCSKFNADISGWNVSTVTNMYEMFGTCSEFNSDLSLWNVRNVTDMSRMFVGCSKFNADISGWNVFKVTNMTDMFRGCSAFNSDLSLWKVGNVNNMSNMFLDCPVFRRDISSWNLSGISADANAPTLTDAYINEVQPNFATQYPTAWSFTAPVTASVITTILPVASRAQYYIDGNLRLVRGFKSTWSISGTRQVVLPFTDGAVLNCTVYWGDGTSNAFNNYTVGAGFPKPSRTYTINGTYTLTITGSFTGWSFGAAFGVTPHISRTYLRTISYYGGLSLSPSGSHFQGCTNLTTLPTTTGFGTLNLPTNCSNMFDGCATFTGTGILSLIPNLVTNMSSMFSNCTVFTGDISTWNVTEVMNMSSMFSNCNAFNGNLSTWNVQKVANMSNMFLNCANFTGNFTGNGIFNLTANNMVTDMSSMFSNCILFNGNISAWNVAEVKNMPSMFSNCTAFNKNLSNWNVQKVENMSSMFSNCGNFTGLIFSLNADNMVNNMSSMFSNCTVFNGNISTWDVQKVTNMSNMFLNCGNFKQDVSNWIVTGISANANAPAFTHDYIQTVKPKFSSGNPAAWSFTGPGVTVKVIETILPETASRALYTMDGLRLVIFTNNRKSSAISTSSRITDSYNSVIKRFI